ncbi:MAG: universal stress protein, partial [Rubripirellula sp.]
MKVLLAIDGSKCSEDAARLLSHLPHTEKLDVTILSVIAPPITAFYSPAKQVMEEFTEDDRRFAKKRQESTERLFSGANATVQTRIREGRPAETIVDCAEAWGADLIVLGAKGHSQINRILLGGTSDYVATHAHCSVLVVRPSADRDGDATDLKVAVAYDSSNASRASLQELLLFDWGAHTDITVVGVAGYSPVFNPEFGFNPETLKREAKNALQQARVQMKSKVANIHDEVIEYDHVAEGLVKYTEDNDTDLIVIGDTGRSTLARALLGSVSRHVLRHAKCGV